MRLKRHMMIGEAFGPPSQFSGDLVRPRDGLALSDGQSRVSDKNIQDLQVLANDTAVAYGADADKATMSRIASDGRVHVVGDNGGALRDFLAAVGATIVSTIKASM